MYTDYTVQYYMSYKHIVCVVAYGKCTDPSEPKEEL